MAADIIAHECFVQKDKVEEKPNDSQKWWKSQGKEYTHRLDMHTTFFWASDVGSQTTHRPYSGNDTLLEYRHLPFLVNEKSNSIEFLWLSLVGLIIRQSRRDATTDKLSPASLLCTLFSKIVSGFISRLRNLSFKCVYALSDSRALKPTFWVGLNRLMHSQGHSDSTGLLNRSVYSLVFWKGRTTKAHGHVSDGLKARVGLTEFASKAFHFAVVHIIRL